MPRPALLRLLTLVCGIALLAPTVAAAPVAAGPVVQQPGGADPDKRSEKAKAALAKVERIFSDTTTAAAPADEHARPDLTIALRDLALLQEELPPAEREVAASYLARPTNGKNNDQVYYKTKNVHTAGCDDDASPVCVHYVLKADDSHSGVAATDTNPANGTPDYVDFALAQLIKVHDKYVAAGYRPPLPDGNRGGNSKPDIYLAQLGDLGYYGYCATDDKSAAGWTAHTGVFGYCVLDNDYKKSEFPSNTPKQNLQVTAAHEYFHNVQFGYDIAEDAWFMEATATWAEDEVYDGVNDNVFYLRHGPLAKPRISLDAFKRLYPYGAWIFIRFLTEQYDAGAEMPDLVRTMWEKADAEEGPDQYSVQAIRNTLAAQGTTLSDEFAQFATVNRRPKRFYDEAKANKYPSAPLADGFKLTRTAPRKKVAVSIDHLTSRTYRFRPAAELKHHWFLRLKLDLNDLAKGGAAFYTVKPVGGAPVSRQIKLNDQGNRVLRGKKIKFASAKVRWVEVTIANASSRYKCNTGASWQFTCRGRARDDKAPQLVVGKAIKP